MRVEPEKTKRVVEEKRKREHSDKTTSATNPTKERKEAGMETNNVKVSTTEK